MLESKVVKFNPLQSKVSVSSSSLALSDGSVYPKSGRFVRIILLSNKRLPKYFIARIPEEDEEFYKVICMKENNPCYFG